MGGLSEERGREGQRARRPSWGGGARFEVEPKSGGGRMEEVELVWEEWWGEGESRPQAEPGLGISPY